jgi:DNA-binding transcriptional MocR family regulator
MYLTAWLPPDRSDIAAADALAKAGVAAVPLSALTLETARRPGLVLGYTGHGEAATLRAVATMANVLRSSGLINISKADLRSDRIRA